MATGISPARARASIDAVVALGTWIQLHTGDPGAAGTSNVAGNDTRKQATFGAAAGTPAQAVTTALLRWESGEVDTGEDYTHWSMWTASSAGTFLHSGTLTADAVLVGNAFEVPSGSLSLTMTGAS